MKERRGRSERWDEGGAEQFNLSSICIGSPKERSRRGNGGLEQSERRADSEAEKGEPKSGSEG